MADKDGLAGLTIGDPMLEGAVVKVPVSIARAWASTRLLLRTELPAGMDAAELVVELDMEQLGAWYVRALLSKGRESKIAGGVLVVRTAGARPVWRKPREGGPG